MNRNNIGLILLGMLAAWIGSSTAAPEKRDFPAVDRERPTRNAVRRPAEREPMPEGARLPEVSAEVEAAIARPGALPPIPNGVYDPSPAELQRHASAAAHWAARESASSLGRREYFRIGFFTGLRNAVDDRSIGDWDFRQGQRYGSRDPEARRVGLERGEADADDLAREDAPARVESQFRNLAGEPVYAPSARPSRGPQIIEIDPPVLSDVFREHPVAEYESLSPEFFDYLVDWPLGGWQLTQCADYRDFHDLAWRDPRTGFDLWHAEKRHSRFLRRLDGVERRDFRVAFDIAYVEALRVHFKRMLTRQYEMGFDAGWDYGAFIQEEWSFRQGFHEAYAQRVNRAAQSGFERSFPSSFATAYAESFAQWRDHPHVELGAVSLRDTDDDGIFEPGEEVRLEYELVNYGGAAGEIPVRLEGEALETVGRATAQVPARARTDEVPSLTGRIDARTSPRTDASLTVALESDQIEVPLYISRPLEFQRNGLELRRDNLSGVVEMVVRVVNRSRKPVAGELTLAVPFSSVESQSRRLGVLESGAEQAVSFDVRGLSPLELIAGQVSLDLDLTRNETSQDSWSHRLPETARDLGSQDLPRLLVMQAQNLDTSPDEIVSARRLLMQRLRQDWNVAIRSSGNPYKKDLKKGGSRTALGELKEISDGSDWRRPEVFAGLSREVDELVDELPGAHPFLRKYMRRLAARLP